ncbi:MAG: hypothetical protein LBL42_04275 [Tannerella sp.]|jgi:hypothetical protein|nr:hypothetical protein [Tannerella sp.]
MAKKETAAAAPPQHRDTAKRLATQYGVQKVWGSTDGRFWATSEAARDKTLKGKEVDEYSFPSQTPAQEE